MIDAVLDRWAAGEGAGTIARDFRFDAACVRKIVRKARASGDRRAVSHAHLVAGTAGWRRHYVIAARIGKLIARWEFRP